MYSTYQIKNKINPTSYSLAQLHSFVEAITDDLYLRLYTICLFSPVFCSFFFFCSHFKVNTSNHFQQSLTLCNNDRWQYLTNICNTRVLEVDMRDEANGLEGDKERNNSSTFFFPPVCFSGSFFLFLFNSSLSNSSRMPTF